VIRVDRASAFLPRKSIDRARQFNALDGAHLREEAYGWAK